jgi:DNA-binding MarR family transcriptional regulator
VFGVHPDPDFSPIGRSLGRAHKFMHAWGDRELAPLGASVTDFILFTHIDQAPEPGLSQTEIARFSDMGGPALVRHLDRLERDGFVVRTRDAADRRIMRVQLTDTGRARQAELKAVIARIDDRVRSVLTAKEADVLQAALDKVFDLALGELYGPSAALPFTPTPSPPPRSTR